MPKSIETQEQALKRVQTGLIKFRLQAEIAAALIWEAKTKKLWTAKYSSWNEFCELGCGYSKQWAHQLFQKYETKLEIDGWISAWGEMRSKSVPTVKSLDSSEAVLLGNKQKKCLSSERTLTITTERKNSFSKDETPRDYSCAYSSTSTPEKRTEETDERDPSDKISRSTPSDVSVAREVSEEYPKRITTTLITREEEDSYGVWLASILVKRGTKTLPKKIDMREVVRAVCKAYKQVTKKTLSVKPADAGQIRRLLESGITLEEFIETGEKAWLSKSFLARYSHQPAMFVKHYGNIRNEMAEETEKQESAKSVNPQNYLNA